MKSILLLIMLTCVAFGQKVEMSDTVTPEDLGSYKFKLSGIAQDDEVVVFRLIQKVTDADGEESVMVSDLICYEPSIEVETSVFFYNPAFFTTSSSGETVWFYRAMGISSGPISGKFKTVAYDGKKPMIRFVDDEEHITEFMLETLVMKYSEVSEIYDELPSIADPSKPKWRWSGGFEGDTHIE